MKTILILSANPQGTSPLRLDEEVREIDAGLQRAKNRGEFVLEQKWAVRPRDIQRAMLDINPQIVHFSGHGMGDEGLVFADDTGQIKLIDGEALAGLFGLFADSVECVVLNGCYSQVQAEAIAQQINYVIGMKQAIGDKAAIEFAIGFYDALGNGRNIEFAYNFGCVAIRLAGIPEQLTPVLNQKPHSEQVKVPVQAEAQAAKNATLTFGERQRLQTEYNELQQQYNSLSEEIQFLQQSQQTQHLDPKDQFRLKKQIEQAKEERQNLSEKIAALEHKLA